MGGPHRHLPVFNTPSFPIITDLITGWSLARDRPTVTAMAIVVDPARRWLRRPITASFVTAPG